MKFKFRTALLLGLLVVIAGVVVATVAAVATVLDREARRQLTQDLGRNATVFSDLQAYRQQQFQSEARVVAEEPRIKAVMAAEGVDQKTVLDVAVEMQKVVRCELFLIVDGEGRLIVDATNPDATGASLKEKAIVASALEKGEASGIWTEAKAAYQVQAHRVAFGATTVGAVVIGHAIDDRVAETVFRQTGGSIVLELNGQPIATSAFDGEVKVERGSLGPVLASIPSGAAPIEVLVGGAKYLALAAPFPGYKGHEGLRYHVLRSLDRALAPGKRLTRVLYGISVVALLAGLGIAGALSRKLSRPIDDLVLFAGRIGEGDLRARTAVAGPVELQVLGDAMNKMAEEIDDSRRTLEKQYEELRVLDKLKDQFLANTSHELRTPINGILGLVSAVLEGADGPLNSRQAKHLNMVKDSGERLKNLIGNILDFSKMKAGKQAFEFSSFKAVDLAPHIEALAEGLVRNKPVKVAIEIATDLPPVWGDFERVLQVMTNLVGNATKFTAEGHVRIFAKADNGDVAFYVEDTGPGIPPEAREYLFQEFRQVDGSTNREYEGTGLGLAICKELVTAHGGRIDFRSEVGKGTTFFFTLPTKPGAAPTVGARGATAEKTNGKSARSIADDGEKTVIAQPETTMADEVKLRGGGEVILVVDDQPANIEVFRLQLSGAGYNVIAADNPIQALELLKTQKVHLILSDVRMPSMSGLEVCQAVKSSPELKNTPVFLVTAQAKTAMDLHAASEVAADAYIVKPYEPPVLLECIRAVLRPSPETPRAKGERVLIIDDTPIAAEGTAAQLRAYGYQTVVETDGAKAVETAVQTKPDLVILDVRLGKDKDDGYAVCKKLRSDARFERLPVLMVSGAAAPGDRKKAQDAGAQDFIPKPFVPEDFLTRVAFHLRQQAAEGARQGHGEKILVVDDLEVNVEALALQLEYRGYKPLPALSGKQALEIAKVEKPHAVITDVMMPGMTGYDLCRELSQDASLGPPPVILLTAKSGTVQDALLGFDAGAIDYVVKPFEPEELMARLARILKRTGRAVQAPSADAEKTAVMSTADIKYEAVDTASLGIRGSGELILCVDDSPINLEVLKTHLEAVNYRVVLAKDGFEGMEKLQKEPVELILLDVMMPRMSGFEFVERMRKMPKHKDTPVVIISAKDRIEDSINGLKLGVVDYITKPFNGTLVAAKVAAIVALRRAHTVLGTINAELQVARLVQQASFPPQVLEIPGASLSGLVQSTESAGGDWYGFFVSPDQDRITIFAGDVTGHGVGAALVALAANSVKSTIALIEGMLNSARSAESVLSALSGKVPKPVYDGFARLLQIPHSPSAFATLVNEVFCGSKSVLHMSSILCNYHVPSGTVKYTIAAAPKPLHLKKKEEIFDVELLAAPPGRMLGDARDATYSEQSITLTPGEAIVIYSDGVTEAVGGADGKQYGTRRLRQALRNVTKGGIPPKATVIRDGVLSDLFSFTADEPMEDDVTVVVLQKPHPG